MTTQQFELPVVCPTCQAMRTAWSIERRYASDSGTEQATYKCGCRMECYLSYKRHDIREECPQNPAQQATAAREEATDEAGASALEVCEHAESATSALVAHSQAIPVRSEVMVCDEPWGEAAVALPD